MTNRKLIQSYNTKINPVLIHDSDDLTNNDAYLRSKFSRQHKKKQTKSVWFLCPKKKYSSYIS